MTATILLLCEWVMQVIGMKVESRFWHIIALFYVVIFCLAKVLLCFMFICIWRANGCVQFGKIVWIVLVVTNLLECEKPHMSSNGLIHDYTKDIPAKLYARALLQLIHVLLLSRYYPPLCLTTFFSFVNNVFIFEKDIWC